MLLLARYVIVVCTEYKFSLNGLLYEVGSFFQAAEKITFSFMFKGPDTQTSPLTRALMMQ